MSVKMLMAVAALLAQSQTKPATDTAAVGSNTVEGLTVRPHPKCLEAESATAPAPKIVRIFPGEGQVVRPGLLVIRITFDRPMTCGGFLAALADVASPCPSRVQNFIQTFDHRTVRTLCLTRPGQAYGVLVGGDCDHPFVSLDNQQAQPLAVRFSTSDGPAVASVAEALAEANAPSPVIPSPESPVIHALDGTWRGAVTDQLGWRPLVLHVSTVPNGAFAATLDSPYRHAFRLPVQDFRLVGDTVAFRLPSLDDSYAGTLSADGSKIRGFWAQEHKATDFTLNGCPSG